MKQICQIKSGALDLINFTNTDKGRLLVRLIDGNFDIISEILILRYTNIKDHDIIDKIISASKKIYENNKFIRFNSIIDFISLRGKSLNYSLKKIKQRKKNTYIIESNNSKVKEFPIINKYILEKMVTFYTLAKQNKHLKFKETSIFYKNLQKIRLRAKLKNKIRLLINQRQF